MLDDLKYFDGSITEIERIPAEVKQLFLTAFEIEPEWLIECASRRQKWIDMGQSLNLYLLSQRQETASDVPVLPGQEVLRRPIISAHLRLRRSKNRLPTSITVVCSRAG